LKDRDRRPGDEVVFIALLFLPTTAGWRQLVVELVPLMILEK
jgi:hypothetical protein